MGPLPKIRSVPAADPPSDLAGLFRIYSGYVATIAVRILGREDEVDDVVQDVFMAALSGLDSIRSPEATKSWLGTVAVRKASYRLKRRRILSFVGLADAPCADIPAPGMSPEERALLHRAYAALELLPVAERVVWILRHIEGEQLDGVARLAGCSLATAKRRLLAAHQAIERTLHES